MGAASVFDGLMVGVIATADGRKGGAGRLARNHHCESEGTDRDVESSRPLTYVRTELLRLRRHARDRELPFVFAHSTFSFFHADNSAWLHSLVS